MFGYVTVNRPELKVKDLELYRSYYCGLCAELYRRHGRFGQILLSYDCTFLLLLRHRVIFSRPTPEAAPRVSVLRSYVSPPVCLTSSM